MMCPGDHDAESMILPDTVVCNVTPASVHKIHIRQTDTDRQMGSQYTRRHTHIHTNCFNGDFPGKPGLAFSYLHPE